MILIISGTNRHGSNTHKVAKTYEKLIQEQGVPVQLLSLEFLKNIKKDADFIKIEADLLIPSKKMMILAPEYNGSIPGVLKLMIDLSDISKVFYHKKIALTGVSDGRSGNLRGLDHLTNILNYLKVQVMPDKIPISVVSSLLDETGTFLEDAATLKVIKTQITEFINF
jgi:NAD(P)H-dependent FMN reductase